MTSLVERHAEKIVGTLSCYDRVIIQGTLPGVGYAAGMTGYLKARGLRIFDFATALQAAHRSHPRERPADRRRGGPQDRVHPQSEEPAQGRPNRGGAGGTR